MKLIGTSKEGGIKLVLKAGEWKSMQQLMASKDMGLVATVSGPFSALGGH